MNISELTRDQLVELKQSYLTVLADQGDYAEVMGVDYDEPSYHDLANADSIVPDDVVFDYYEGMEFSDDDFICTAGEALSYQVLSLATRQDILGEALSAEELATLLPELIAKHGAIIVNEA